MRSKIEAYLNIRRRRRQIMPSYWRRRPWLMVVVVVAVVAGVLAHRSVGPLRVADDYERYHRKVFRVARAVDGDTVDLAVPDGKHPRTRVRFWGVDTPEVAGSGRGEMYYGPEASAFTKAALTGRDVTVWLIRGKTRDRYGRLLAYVAIRDQDTTFNERLIETGHGYADWRFEHPHREQFRAAERRARRGRRGLWAAVRPDQMPGWRQRMSRRSKPRRATSAPEPGRTSTSGSGLR